MEQQKMASKEKHKAIVEGYFYVCSPYCKTTLTHGTNGNDAFIKCPLCTEYVHRI